MTSGGAAEVAGSQGRGGAVGTIVFLEAVCAAIGFIGGWLIRGKFAMRRRYPKTWEWRLALNHRLFDVDGVPTFHAYDASDHAACEPALGLTTSIAVPTRKSNRCPRCLAVVRKKR